MRDMNAPAEIGRLASRLESGELPGWSAQSLACPPGRPPDLASKMSTARRAGVMCLLCPNEHGEWCVVLMRRTVDGTPHSGQLAFPGGAEDPEDSGDLLETAKRECAEEVGVDVSSERMLGALSPLYIPPSDFWVQPYVSWSPTPLRFKIQVEEVAEVIVWPLHKLPEAFEPWPTQRVSVRGGFARVPGCPVQGGVLWGATAMMMSELRTVCSLSGFGPSFAEAKTFSP